MSGASKRIRVLRVVAVCLVLAFLGATFGGALGATSASASPDPGAEGLWYYASSDLGAVHERTTGKGINVAVLDTPVNPAAPDLVGANLITRPDSFCEDEQGAVQPGTGTSENAVHGTSMASMIVGTGAGVGGEPGTLGVAPGVTLRHYAVLIDDYSDCRIRNLAGLAAGIDQAVADGAQIVSISSSGGESDDELAAIARAEQAGVIVVAASKHDAGDLGWPASANGVVSVESSDASQQLTEDAVTSPLLSVVAPGEAIRRIDWSDGRWDTYRLSYGSSTATAWTSGVLALVWSAHPDATASQVIQTLLRNTSTGGGELVRDDSGGYGEVSVANMLKVDPSTYPDVNPLLRKGADAKPAYGDIVKSAAPSGAGETADQTDGRNGPLQLVLIGGVVVLAVLILTGIAIAVVLTRRRRAAAQLVPSEQYPVVK